MRIIKELIDDDIFIDIILEPADIECLNDVSLEPAQIEIDDKVINLWVRTATTRELYDYSEWEDDE